MQPRQTPTTRPASRTDELSVQQFRSVLTALPAHLPISDDFEQDFPQKQGAWWKSQRQHMLGWLDHQLTRGGGKFSRKAPNTSARLAYTRLNSAPAIVWIAEAVGVDADLVQAAVEEARAEPNRRRHCGILRRHLPWSLIAEHAEAVARP